MTLSIAFRFMLSTIKISADAEAQAEACASGEEVRSRPSSVVRTVGWAIAQRFREAPHPLTKPLFPSPRTPIRGLRLRLSFRWVQSVDSGIRRNDAFQKLSVLDFLAFVAPTAHFRPVTI
jgi:hypothetical protein